MLILLHVDVAKVFLDVVLLYLLQVFYLDVASVLDIFFLCCECYYLMLRWTDGASNGKSSHRMFGR